MRPFLSVSGAAFGSRARSFALNVGDSQTMQGFGACGAFDDLPRAANVRIVSAGRKISTGVDRIDHPSRVVTG
jgi:hypothetical protein